MDSSRSRLVTLLAASVTVYSLFAVQITHAANPGFLKDSPASYFDDEDMRLLQAAALNVLKNESAYSKQSWTNPATGHSGEIG